MVVKADEGIVTPGKDDSVTALMDDAEVANDGFDEAMEDELGFESSAANADADDAKTAAEKEAEEAAAAEKAAATDDKGEKDTENEDDDDRTDEEKKADEKLADKLPSEVQESVNRRIGKEVAKRKTIETQLTAETAKIETLQERIDELEAAGPEASAAPANVPKIFLAENEAQLTKREDHLWEVEKFCTRYKEGYIGTGTEEDPQYTAEQIQERLLEVREERERYLPKARDMIKQRQASTTEARKQYPDLANPKSELALRAKSLFRQVPGLRMLPNAELLIGDMLAGREARQAKGTKTTTPPAKPATTIKTKPGEKVVKPAPAEPSKATTTKPGPVTSKTPKEKNTFETFAESGFDEEALAEAWD